MYIAIIEPQPLKRAGIHRLLLHEHAHAHDIDEFERIKDFENLLFDRNQQIEFDAVIIGDITCSPDDRASYIQRWSRHFPDLLVVIVSQHHSYTGVAKAQRAGAHIILDSRDFNATTVATLFTHCRDTQVLSQHVSNMVFQREYEANQLQLNQIDVDVLHSMAEGYCNTEIATLFGINRRSLYRIRNRLRTTLNVKTDAQVVDTARKRGLI